MDANPATDAISFGDARLAEMDERGETCHDGGSSSLALIRRLLYAGLLCVGADMGNPYYGYTKTRQP